MTDPASPAPATRAMDERLEQVLERIPTGARGRISVAVSTAAAEIELAARAKKKAVTLEGAGWAGRQWGTNGWAAGVRGSLWW